MVPPPRMKYGHHVGVKAPNRVGFKTAESWAPLPKTPPRSGLYCGHVVRTSRRPQALRTCRCADHAAWAKPPRKRRSEPPSKSVCRILFPGGAPKQLVGLSVAVGW